MRTNVSEFIENLSKIIDKARGKTMLLQMPPDGLIYVDAEYFSYQDIQRFYHLLTRTQCEWFINPSQVLEKGVRLKIRLF